jgi:integrase
LIGSEITVDNGKGAGDRHMLAKGMSVIEVAKLTGHDPKVLLEHYAGLITQIEVPTFF